MAGGIGRRSGERIAVPRRVVAVDAGRVDRGCAMRSMTIGLCLAVIAVVILAGVPTRPVGATLPTDDADRVA